MVKPLTHIEQINNEFLKIHRISVVMVNVDKYGNVWNHAKDIVKPAMSDLPATKQDVVDFKKGMSNYRVKPEDIHHLYSPKFTEMKNFRI